MALTYDYRCLGCDYTWEEEQRISEPPLVFCPSCGLPWAERLISAPAAFHLKGRGWTPKTTTANDPGKRKAGGWT